MARDGIAQSPTGGTIININLPFPDTAVNSSVTQSGYSCFFITPGTCDGTGSVAGFSVATNFAATNLRVVALVTDCFPGSPGTPYAFGTVIGPNQLLCTDFVFAPLAVGSLAETIVESDTAGSTNWNCSGNGICPIISLTPAALPGGVVGTNYNQTITASGGTAPYAFALSSGSLPPGLNLSSSGVISGVPTTNGSFTFSVTVSDATPPQGCSQTFTYTISIGCVSLTISPATLPGAVVGVFYSQVIAAAGGSGSYSFRRSAGFFPGGVSLTAGGLLSGSPTAAGSFMFSVTVTDLVTGCFQTRSYTMVVSCPAIAVTPATLPAGAVGVDYGPVTLGATAGAPPNSFKVASGALPDGLTLVPSASASAQIGGKPTVDGSFSFDISVTDRAGCTGRQSYTVVIVKGCQVDAPENPTLAPAGNPDGPVTGVDYLDVSWSPPSGGSPPSSYVWQINGRDPVSTTETSVPTPVEPQALVVQNYNNDPIQLSVYALACGTPAIAGPVATSPSYDPAPPEAAFDASVSGRTVTVTDNSGTQATSWLWLWGDGAFSTEQAPEPHTYPDTNVYTIALVATNGAGSNQTSSPVQLSAVELSPRGLVARDFDATNPSRQRLESVQLAGRGPVWLRLTANTSPNEKIAYLRFLDKDGKALAERRLSVAPDQTGAAYNVEAFGMRGTFTIELVTHDGMAATLVEAAPLNRADPPPAPRRIER